VDNLDLKYDRKDIRKAQALYDSGKIFEEIAKEMNWPDVDVQKYVVTNEYRALVQQWPVDYQRFGKDHPGWKGGVKWTQGYCWIKIIGL
jgi:hypothetical protein